MAAEHEGEFKVGTSIDFSENISEIWYPTMELAFKIIGNHRILHQKHVNGIRSKERWTPVPTID